MIRSIALGLTVLLLVAGCGQADKGNTPKAPKAATPSGWSELTKPGFTDDYVAAAFFSRDSTAAMATDDAYLAFIKSSGAVKMEKVAPIQNGILRSRGQALGFDSEKDTFLIDGSKSNAIRRGEKNVPTGHWASFTNSGWDVSVLNVGRLSDGYLTEVFAHNGSRLVRNEIRDVPGATGISGDNLYLMSSGSSNTDGTISLYQTDVTKQDSTKQVLEFRAVPDPTKGAYSSISGLQIVDSAAWFTYYVTPIAADGAYLTKKRTLHLGRIDLSTKKFTERLLSQQPYLLADGPKGVVPVSVAGLDGHLYDGQMYTINTAGQIMAIDLERATTSNLGKVSEFARNSFRVMASWRDEQLTLLSIDGRGGAKLETYSLKDGSSVSTIDVPELGSWYANNFSTLPWSVTTLGN